MDLSILNHKIRKDIFNKLLYNAELSFSQIYKDMSVRSNIFTYHLKELMNHKIISKNKESNYYMTEAGKQLAQYADKLKIDNMEKQPFIIIGVVIKDGDKMLVSKITRYPFKDIWSTSVSGRMRFGETVRNSAIRQTLNDTGYEPLDLDLKLVCSVRTFNDSKLLFHHMSYFFKCEKFLGKLKKNSPDRVNKWVDINEFVETHNMFKDIPIILDCLNKEGVTIKEIKREYNGESFTDAVVLEDITHE